MERPGEGQGESAIAERPQRGLGSARLVISDSSNLFTMVATLSWVALVAAPLLISSALDSLAGGIPLLGVALWLGLLRVARWLSPLTRADALIQRSAYADALALCDETLGVSGAGAWVGSRRLAWLNRRFSALLGLGRYDEALAATVDAMEVSPDPETIANFALALLRLNHYEGAITAAREASALTHGRSVRANATLAWAMLARGQPAEGEALASMSLADIEVLSPYVRRENHVTSLGALAHAQRLLGMRRQASATVARLRRLTKRSPTLISAALLEEASLSENEPTHAAELVTFAFASDPAYTGWYLTQPDTLTFLREAPEVGPLFVQGAEGQARMNTRTPDDEVIARLLASLRPDERARPTLQRSGTALNIQLITLGATLILLLFWMWRFFVSQTF
ncbi:MAG: tetratricopeptide repeat protein [Chloroflexota bacterium]|nr:tetratricopeptide repeat protein [Chloroflexota bacterium]